MVQPNFDSTEEVRCNVPAVKTNRLDQLANQLRSTWIEERRRYISKANPGYISNYSPGPGLDGGVVAATGRRCKPIWPSFAKWIDTNRLNPVKFIRAQFENCRGRPPDSPTQLMSPRALARYEQYVGTREYVSELRIALDSQLMAARNAVETNKLLYGSSAYRVTILDSNLGLTALFRYALATRTPENYDLVSAYKEAALYQYLYERDAYDEVWGTMIPDDLKQAADAVEMK